MESVLKNSSADVDLESPSTERRSSPRLPVRMPVSFEINDKPFVGVTQNVNHGGALIELIGDMPAPDAEFDVQFYIPASTEVWPDDLRGYCESKAIRVAPPKKGDKPLSQGLVAVRFLNEMRFQF